MCANGVFQPSARADVQGRSSRHDGGTQTEINKIKRNYLVAEIFQINPTLPVDSMILHCAVNQLF